MNNFRTDVRIIRSLSQIRLKNPILTAGSCFADAIGARLDRYKFQVLTNPFGIIYNPVSIHKSLLYAIANEPPPDHSYLHHQGVYLNYDFHSVISALNKYDLSEKLLNRLGSVHYFLKHASRIQITYGTAWVYQRKDTGETVANCHKMPSQSFEKRLLSEKEITGSFQEFYERVRKFNPSIKFILTVSPVRHIKDTLELNSVSKAVLRAACHSLSATDDVEYFPAFEIMMDDLRDYRFYKSDMLHPTEVAEDYIWEKFGEKYFDDETKAFLRKWDEILSAIQHRPFHPSSPAHQGFLKDTLRKLEDLKVSVDVEEEIRMINSQITPATLF
jgi:hypothetical protein